MKTNKATRKRVKVTKKGVRRVRGTGFGHLNSKTPRKKQLRRNRGRELIMTKKSESRFLAHIK